MIERDEFYAMLRYFEAAPFESLMFYSGWVIEEEAGERVAHCLRKVPFMGYTIDGRYAIVELDDMVKVCAVSGAHVVEFVAKVDYNM